MTEISIDFDVRVDGELVALTIGSRDDLLFAINLNTKDASLLAADLITATDILRYRSGDDE